MTENKAPDMNEGELVRIDRMRFIEKQSRTTSRPPRLEEKKRLVRKAIAESVNDISSTHRSEDQIKIKIKKIKEKGGYLWVISPTFRLRVN